MGIDSPFLPVSVRKASCKRTILSLTVGGLLSQRTVGVASILPSLCMTCSRACHLGPAGTKAPRILFYGHRDVQPPDQLELWTSPPFDPQLVDGPHGKRVVARGAVDDKGQLMMFVEALRAWTQVGGGIPAPVTVLLEGEEGTIGSDEGGGGSIPVVEQIKRTLNIDSLLMGFGLDDDQIHSPNEKFEMRCFHQGTRSHAILLGKLADGT
jgi:acetylornithine deacetylase/succinyl-diaminopimelate desuccinylase-like protein